jgi:hypothetical protein
MTWLDTQDTGKVQEWQAAYRTLASLSHIREYDGGDERFGVWLALVNARLTRGVGVGLFDLADWNMRDAYEDGMSPREAALEALRNDDTFAGLVEEAGL